MIQIQEPEIEALIQQRLTAGGFDNVAEVLRQALTDAPLPKVLCSHVPRTGAELYEALRNSPYKEVDLEPQRYYSPVSDPIEF